MKITLIAVGTKMPAWITTGFEEYQRRFPKDMPFELIEISAGKRGKNAGSISFSQSSPPWRTS